MINSAELADKEKKVTLESLNERHKNQVKTVAQLQEKHQKKIAKLIEEISNKLRAEYQPIDKTTLEPYRYDLALTSPKEQIQAAHEKANNFMAYAHFTGLLTALKPEELECLDKISLDRIPHAPAALDCDSVEQNKQLLINALKRFDLNTLKLLHAIMNQQEDKVLKLLEEGVQPNFSVFSVFILHFLFEKIIMEPFNTDINQRHYHEVIEAYANPDVLNEPEHPSKNTALRILDSLLCYGFQPGHLLYNAPGIRLVMHMDEYYEKADLVLEALSRKSFLVDHLKDIDQTHAAKLISSVFQNIYNKFFNFSNIFTQFSSVVLQQREEIAERLAEEQQKIERNPVEAGLAKFMEATEMETVIPCKPVAALVFKYLVDPSKNVFAELQVQKRYKYVFHGIFPPG